MRRPRPFAAVCAEVRPEVVDNDQQHRGPPEAGAGVGHLGRRSAALMWQALKLQRSGGYGEMRLDNVPSKVAKQSCRARSKFSSFLVRASLL